MATGREQHLASVSGLPHRAVELEASTPETVLRWALTRWGRRAALVTSFQAGGMALLDLATRIDPNLRVLTIDTGRLPQQTYELIERVRSRYRVEVELVFPDFIGVEKMVRQHGPNLFFESHDKRMECCATRKSDPLRRALSGLDAWITGARRGQTPARSALRKVGADPLHPGLMKIAPLADWSDETLWDYLREFDVPYNELYDRGYASIGCAPCTRAVRDGDGPRAGRWWWEVGQHKECGLHIDVTRAGAIDGHRCAPKDGA